MHVPKGGLEVVKTLAVIVSNWWDRASTKLIRKRILAMNWFDKRRIMVMKGFDNVHVEKQWRVVSIMWNGMQNMCMTKDNVNALKWKRSTMIINGWVGRHGG
jgi:hypothetical protein